MAGSLQVDAQVTGARSEVDDGAVLRKSELAHGAAPPACVESEGHDPIDEVVSRGDGVEHVADRSDLLVALREGVAVPSTCCHVPEATGASGIMRG